MTPPQSTLQARTRPAGHHEVTLDLREQLRSGGEPFQQIMIAVAALRDNETLRLLTTFEPLPLYRVLGKRGFDHAAEAYADDDWSVWFWQTVAQPDATPDAPDSRSTPAAADEVMLDVRGLEPPEPMLRTLTALESLPEGHTLVQVNVRAPQFLLPMLAERGFEYEVDESQVDRVLVRIRRRR